MSSTFIEFIYIKIGLADCKGHGVAGNTSLNVISLMTLFCKIMILSSSVLNAEPHTTIA